ncbi:hypothetical protein BH20ACT5_BH20ACT5_13850 [soil metagenome]
MSAPGEVIAHYDEGQEAARLVTGAGRLELWRTQDILLRQLPPAPASVLDVGGGPGVYAAWLTGLGYAVHVVDPVPLHVEQAGRLAGVDASLGDARDLGGPESAYDDVLTLGLLYHLIERADRLRALRELARVSRPGGPVAVAAISRYAPVHDGYLKDRLAAARFVESEPSLLGVSAHLLALARSGNGTEPSVCGGPRLA